MQNKEGARVPEVTFPTRSGSDWVDVTTSEIFSGRTVVVFSLPGAFTPTCSAAHLPRYEELHGAFAALGVDDVVCVSVNDTFVMNAWAEAQGVGKVRMLPDGTGAFTEGMGMLVDKDDLGFGKRSWRYSMLVRDGVIEKMFIEPDRAGDPFDVSDADTMLSYLSPDSGQDRSVTVVTRDGCPHCARAKKALGEAGIGFEEVRLDGALTTRTLRALAGADTVPQVFVDGRLIGGADDLEAYLAKAAA